MDFEKSGKKNGSRLKFNALSGLRYATNVSD